jgi:hypothetical protein
MKKLILISSHCDSPAKLKVLKTNLEILRKFEVSILLYSTVNLDFEITNYVDYYFFNTNNPIDQGRSLLFWSEKNCDGKKIKFHRFWRDHTFSGFTQIKFLINFSQFLGYDLNYFILYDLIITNQVSDFIEKQSKESFFTFQAFENGQLLVNDCASQLFCDSQSKILDLEKLFIWEESQKFACIEHFIANLASKLEIPINRDFIVEDHIYQMRNWIDDWYNHSPWKEFKIYFSKNLDFPDAGKCLIYDVEKDIEIFIRRNRDVKKIKISEIKEFEISSSDLELDIWYNGIIFDILHNFYKFPGGGWEFYN